MKKITILFLFFIGVFFTSCEYDLDINNSPNAPQEAAPDQRLPYILAETVDFYGSHGTRTANLTQQLGYAYRPGYRYYMFQNWQLANNADAWVWQCWYGYAWVNIEEMLNDAEDAEAWHYTGVGKILKAFGTGTLVDAYGYIAYKDGIAGNIQPDYDDAEYVYSQILPLIDEGIADLQKTQGENAPNLAVGDVMFNGDIDKWIKFAYGVKARFMSHLSKKAEGTDLLAYNPTGILSNIEKSFQSNNDDAEYVGEDGDISARWCIQYQNTGSSNKPGKLWKDYLMNTVDTINGGDETWNSRVVDPRSEVLIPKILEGENEGKFSFAVDLGETDHAPTTDDVNYVGMRSTDDNLLFYTSKTSPYFLLSYSELKFIEAEVYFRQGSMESALTSYHDAIQANMDKLGIPSDESAAFMASEAVVQNTSDLTLSHIMMQKYIACTYSPEVWTDMRRCDYCIGPDGTYDYAAGVYKGFDRPPFVYETAFPQDNDYIRRYQMAYYERYYNAAKVEALGVFENEYMTTPVWWDIED